MQFSSSVMYYVNISYYTLICQIWGLKINILKKWDPLPYLGASEYAYGLWVYNCDISTCLLVTLASASNTNSSHHHIS